MPPTAQKLTYYEILGVPRNATPKEIRKAYGVLSFKYHPDHNRDKLESEKEAAAEKFREITEAYQVLKDPEKKASYDKFGYVSSAVNVDFSGRRRKKNKATHSDAYTQAAAEQKNKHEQQKARRTAAEQKIASINEEIDAQVGLRDWVDEALRRRGDNRTFAKLTGKYVDAYVINADTIDGFYQAIENVITTAQKAKGVHDTYAANYDHKYKQYASAAVQQGLEISSTIQKHSKSKVFTAWCFQDNGEGNIEGQMEILDASLEYIGLIAEWKTVTRSSGYELERVQREADSVLKNSAGNIRDGIKKTKENLACAKAISAIYDARPNTSNTSTRPSIELWRPLATLENDRKSALFSLACTDTDAAELLATTSTDISMVKLVAERKKLAATLSVQLEGTKSNNIWESLRNDCLGWGADSEAKHENHLQTRISETQACIEKAAVLQGLAHDIATAWCREKYLSYPAASNKPEDHRNFYQEILQSVLRSVISDTPNELQRTIDDKQKSLRAYMASNGLLKSSKDEAGFERAAEIIDHQIAQQYHKNKLSVFAKLGIKLIDGTGSIIGGIADKYTPFHLKIQVKRLANMITGDVRQEVLPWHQKPIQENSSPSM